MKSKKRLFIFGSYDKDAIIDETLLHYLRSLSVLGDIVFVMDNNTPKSEINKLGSIKNILHIECVHHGEYDFGSYKRGFQYAHDKKLFDKYDWVYFVNDSVYGPLWNIEPILNDLESRGVDLTGMIDFESEDVPPQVQSWFVGLSNTLIKQPFIEDFFKSVSAQSEKQLIVLKYEDGLTRCCVQHGFKMSTFISGENNTGYHNIYDRPIYILKRGVPFIKKMAILPGIQYLYPYTSGQIVDDIYHNAMRNDKLPMIDYNKIPYEKMFRFTFLSLPIVTIYCQNQKNIRIKSYKVALFDKICIFKIMKKHVI